MFNSPNGYLSYYQRGGVSWMQPIPQFTTSSLCVTNQTLRLLLPYHTLIHTAI